MKVIQAPQHHEYTAAREPFSIYLAVSVAAHGLAIVGMLGSLWLWGKPAYYKPPAYSVSLVDAPLSLRQSTLETPAGGGEKPPEKRPEVNIQEPPVPAEKPAPPPAPPAQRPEATVVEVEPAEAPPKAAAPKKEPEPKKVEPPAPKTVAEPPKKEPEPKKVEPPKKPSEALPPAPKTVATPKAVTEPPKKQPEKSPQPKEAKPPAPPVSATATEVQQAIAKLREQQTREEKAQAQSAQAQQQAADQRLAALRERFGAAGRAAGPGMGAGGGPGAASDMQRIRLQLYQERIRLQIIDAWILPMPQEEARRLQATALLTVSRAGEIAHLKLLQPSGNSLFDESLLRAIKHASPLPPLPEDYQGAFLEVEMRFRPHES